MPEPCTRCGKCCEAEPCRLAPVDKGHCTVYGKRKGTATCYLAKESDVVRMLLGIGKGCDSAVEDKTGPSREHAAAEKAGQRSLFEEAAVV